ncbi:MAG: PH domain-containing protein [Bacteroidaceae bacterium]|nr:PH domain-containing protein [Bacteroidaceae bacterium]
MANYIQKSLEEGEQIIYNGRLHWSSIFRYLFCAAMLALAAVIVIMLGLFKFTEQKHCLTYTGLVLIVLAIIVWAIGRIIRTRTEFAVTNTRFVQKDGIFNIKMTEIPVARIETVNFYQTVWQRFIGTGCVEMVGSGGTSHQVHCIEHPMTVRKVVVASIKNKPEASPIPSQGGVNCPPSPIPSKGGVNNLPTNPSPDRV